MRLSTNEISVLGDLNSSYASARPSHQELNLNLLHKDVLPIKLYGANEMQYQTKRQTVSWSWKSDSNWRGTYVRLITNQGESTTLHTSALLKFWTERVLPTLCYCLQSSRVCWLPLGPYKSLIKFGWPHVLLLCHFLSCNYGCRSQYSLHFPKTKTFRIPQWGNLSYLWYIFIHGADGWPWTTINSAHAYSYQPIELRNH